MTNDDTKRLAQDRQDRIKRAQEALDRIAEIMAELTNTGESK